MDKASTKKYFIYFVIGTIFFTLVPILILAAFYLAADAWGAMVISLGGTIGEVMGLVLLLAILIVLYGVALFIFWRRSKTEFLIALSSLVFAIITLGLLIASNIQKPIHSEVSDRDSTRIAEIRLLAVALELYHDNNGMYPVVAPGCQDISILEEPLVPIVSKLPREAHEAEGHPPYQYAVSADGTQFVLKATLDSYRPAPDTLDGNILGCDCSDLNYCLDENL